MHSRYRGNTDEEDTMKTIWLTLTSAFLFRRLLAAAEKQKDTPSDGRVHIIHLQMTTALQICSHECNCTVIHACMHALKKKLESLQMNMQNSPRFLHFTKTD